MCKEIIINGIIHKQINGKMYVNTSGEIIRIKSAVARRVNMFTDSKGYIKAVVEGEICYVHQIVYREFKGRIPNGYRVCHKDLKRNNNNINNLILEPMEE